MILHPLLLTILVVDTVGALLALTVAVRAFQIVVDWNPAASDRRQLELESISEAVAIQGRWVRGLLFFSTLLYLIGITNILPDVVPGAMCGTGVMQAMDTQGLRALVLRALALAIFSLWFAVQRINLSRPLAPLTRTCARLLLVAMPVYFPALIDTFTSIVELNTQQPVSCCAVVYDQFRSLKEARSAAGLPDNVWLAGYMIGAMVLLVGAGFRLKTRTPPGLPINALLVVCCGFWVPVAGIALVRNLAAYHYGVLQHHCPWCLFLGDYWLVGFPLFGALAVVAFQAMVALLLPLLVRPAMELCAGVRQSVRNAWRLIFAGVLVFLLFSGLPPIIWRLRFGVWLN